MFGSLSTKIAHSTITPALGNQDLRLLQESINKEKELVTSAQRFSRDLGNSADALKQWAAGEGEDLSDVASGSLLLTTHVVSALNTFADHETVIRSQLKEIRTKEEQLDELRRRRKAVGNKLEAQEKRLSKMGSENKGLSQATEQLSSLQTELRQLDSSILVDMARMSDYKRAAMRSSLTLKFGGLVELGEKLTIIGELGKLVAAEVPQDVTPPGQGRAPYPGREAVSNLVAEAARCVQEVTFNANPDTDFSARPASRLHGAGISAHHGEGGPPPEGMRRPTATGEFDVGPGGSRFKEQSYSSQLTSQPSFTSSNMSGGGTMPPMRDYGGGPGPAPVDEFGRPIDGLPMSANTMPAMGGGGAAPIQQMPLSAIQQSMRGPTSPGGQDAYAPAHNNPSGFHPPGPPPQARSQFQAPPPPPPPNVNPSYPSQQDPRILQNPAVSQTSIQPQDPSGSRFNQQYPQGRSGALERGLTLSLPLRERSPGARKPVPQENEMDSPFVPPNDGPSAPSAFKPPAPQITRQGTTDSDIVLGAGEVDLQRTTTLPPKIGLGGDFPEWSLGLEELGLGGSPVKEEDAEGLGKVAADAGEKKDLPEPPAAETRSSLDRPPVSAVPRSLREEGNTSQTSSPITQTPTTYSNTQAPTNYTPATTTPEGPRIIHDHVVDNPNTRTSGNSGRFAMFPDKRKGTAGPSSERDDSAASEALAPPQAKFSSHPGVDRTPSPYPAGVSPGVSPIPTPGSEKQGEILPINVGQQVTPTPPDDRDGFFSPVTAGTDVPRSILLDGAQPRMGSMATPDSNAPGRLRFAPRPPSPITPSPVTPGNPAWASVDSLSRGDGAGPIGKAAPNSMSSPAYMEAGQGRSEQGPTGDVQKSDHRLSVITPLGIHKSKEGGSRPTTPNQGPSTIPQSEMTDDQFNAMLDSFAAQVGSSSSNPPSGVESTNSSRFSSGPNDSSRSYPENSLSSSQGPSQVKNFLSSSGGADSSRGGSSSAQESSLDSTAAHAGSPFPSPTPTSQAPSQGYKLADMPRRGGYGELDGNVAGVGSSAFRAVRDVGVGHRRVGSGGSDTYSDSSSKVISAGAFRRAGGKASPAARSSPAISPAASPRQSYQVAPTGPPPGAIATPRQEYNPVSPATSQNYDYGGGGPGSNYQTAQSTPNPIPGDRNSLPPGAAAPSRFGGQQPGEPSYQQQQRDPRMMMGGGGNPDHLYAQGQGRASPTQVSSPTTRIPTSLLPARPGTAAPLAPIGHNQPPPPPASGYMSNLPPGAPGAYAPPPGQGYSQVIPPWQQQQRPLQQGYQLHSPAPTEFEGSVAHQDAYGGIEDDTTYPTSQAGPSGQWGGAPRYGQGSWNGR